MFIARKNIYEKSNDVFTAWDNCKYGRIINFQRCSLLNLSPLFDQVDQSSLLRLFNTLIDPP